jgi:hypothetical protein
MKLSAPHDEIAKYNSEYINATKHFKVQEWKEMQPIKR